jgi:hypothetical protein
MADTDGFAVAVGPGVAVGVALLVPSRRDEHDRESGCDDREDGRASTARATGHGRARMGIRGTSRFAIHGLLRERVS